MSGISGGRQMVVSRGQLKLLEERMAAGADPLRCARWIGRITDRRPEDVEVLAHAAQDLKLGYHEHLYAAADSAAAARAAQRATTERARP